MQKRGWRNRSPKSVGSPPVIPSSGVSLAIQWDRLHVSVYQVPIVDPARNWLRAHEAIAIALLGRQDRVEPRLAPVQDRQVSGRRAETHDIAFIQIRKLRRQSD